MTTREFVEERLSAEEMNMKPIDWREYRGVCKWLNGWYDKYKMIQAFGDWFIIVKNELAEGRGEKNVARWENDIEHAMDRSIVLGYQIKHGLTKDMWGTSNWLHYYYRQMEELRKEMLTYGVNIPELSELGERLKDRCTSLD